MEKFRKYASVYFIYSVLLIIVPILFIVIYSFTQSKTFDFSSITLNNFRKAFDPLYLNVIYRSLKLAVTTTFITLIIGYVCAYFITKVNKKFQAIVLVLFIVPMWMNALLRTYAWKSILSYNGIFNQILGVFHIEPLNLLNTDFAVLLGMVYNFLPFMIFPIYTSLISIDSDLINAAKDLGSNASQVFRKVIFPLSVPGIITGIIFVFMPSATSFIIPMYLGGGKTDMIGNIIERQFTIIGDWNFGSALSLFILFIMLVSTSLLRKVGDKYEK